jgi:hypothetical protein
MSGRRGILTAAAFFVLTARAHGDVTLTTPFVVANSGDFANCIVTNIDPAKAITVIVELIAVDGSAINASNSCPIPPATLAPRTSCEAIAGHTSMYCQVVSNSKRVRVGAGVFDAQSRQKFEAAGTK